MSLKVPVGGPITGELLGPSDKSLTHRALLFSSVASIPSIIHRPLRGQDCVSTRACLQALGTRFEDEGSSLRAFPVASWQSPKEVLDCGNSGTTMRLLSGLIASRKVLATLDGDASLRRRPMGRIIQPLQAMGAMITGHSAPFTIQGTQLRNLQWKSEVASAQVKSCILLAGMNTEGVTKVEEPSLSRDHTERLLRALGAPIEVNGLEVSLNGPFVPPGFEFTVPVDFSSIAFFVAAACLIPGSNLSCQNVGVNPTRTGMLQVLQRIGANVQVQQADTELGEPLGEVHVQFAAGLRSFKISEDEMPTLIDEVPILSVLATQCDGVSTIRGAKELRKKESDRIKQMVDHLRLAGAQVEEFEDGMEIEGPVRLKGIPVECRHDHRIGMAFAIAAQIAEGETVLIGADTIQSSYPDFWSDLQSLQSQ